MDPIKSLRQQLVKLLEASEAHASFEDVVRDMPFAEQGVKPKGAEHSAWEELEHLRIAQWDIFEFAMNPKHVSPDFPDGYWPKSPNPPNEKAWEHSVQAVLRDRKKFQEYLDDDATDLFAKIPQGDGQTPLRQALAAADHNAYHMGQLVLLRRLLGTWQK